MSKSAKVYPITFLEVWKSTRKEPVRPSVSIPDKRRKKRDKADRKEMRQFV